jgi:hypothetical protein
MDAQTTLFMLSATVRLAVAVIFALAAVQSLRNAAEFTGIVEQYRIAPRWLVSAAARLLPPLELAAAAALLVPVTSHAGGVLGLCLTTLFTGAIAVNLARGRTFIDCGCGGASGQRLSGGLVLRNLTLMAGLVMVVVAPPTGPVDGWTAISVTGASLTLIVTYFAANQLMTNRQTLSQLRSGRSR